MDSEPLSFETLSPIRTRPVVSVIAGQATSDGAGVRLTRVIGSQRLPELDPFLLLDEFGSERPGDYIGGFPAHPHRGFETVTYMLDGRMRHKDNHGNEGLLTPGAVQWMTAGRGIVHSEMPEQEHGLMRGFQLWVNLPAKDKLCAPQYQEFDAARIPQVALAGGGLAKVIAGQLGDVRGPVQQPATEPGYFDLQLPQGAWFEHRLPTTHNVFAYVYEGAVEFAGPDAVGPDSVGRDSGTPVEAQRLAVFGAGEAVRVRGLAAHSRLILVAGRPLGEPVARHGPFVMNTQAELHQAVRDYQSGRF